MKSNEGQGKSLFYVVAIDATITFLSEVIVLISFFLFYRLVASQFSAEIIGIYSLLRRVLAIFIPIVMLGMAEGLSRYIAMASTALEIRKIIFNSSLILLVAVTFIFLVLNVNLELSAKIFLGSKDHADYILPFIFLLTGICIHTFVYSCLRGSLKIKLANVLQLINIGLLPILLMWFHKFQDLEQVIIWLSSFQGIIAIVFALISLDLFAYKINYFSFPIIKQMLVYGLPRVPAPLAAAGLISVGPIISSHFVSIVDTGYLSLCLTLLVGIGGALSPIGVVLLPHVSGLMKQGQLEKLESKLHILVGAMIQILLFVFFQFASFSEFILSLWMGKDFAIAAPVLVLVFLSLNAYGFYVVVRNIIDAVETRPINSINSTIALIFLVSSFFLIAQLSSGASLILKFAFAFSVSVNLLGLLTYRSLVKAVSYDSARDFAHFKYAFCLNLLIFLISLALKKYVVAHWGLWLSYEVVFGLIYVWILWKLKFEWIGLIASNVLKKINELKRS